MSGTKPGGQQCAATNRAKYGEDYYVRLGRLGGKASRTGGFYANRDLASIAGRLGGSLSRRGKYKLTEKERREIRKAYDHLLAVHNKAEQMRAQYSKTPSPLSRIDEGAVIVFDRKRGLVTSDRAA